MTAGGALRSGVRRLGRALPLVAIFYAAATAPALLAAAVLLSLAYGSLGHSAWTTQLAASFDPQWVAELIARYGRMLAMPWPAAIAGSLAIFGLVYLFLLGGAVELLAAGRRFSIEGYFRACGRSFGPLVRLSIAIGFCCAGPLLLNAALARIGRALWGSGSEAAPLIYWGWFRAAAVLCAFALVNLAFEQAAVWMALENRRQALAALSAAVRLIAASRGTLFGIYLVLWLPYAMVLAAGLGSSRVSQTTMTAVVALFLLRQALVAGKTWLWLLFFAAQGALQQGGDA